MSEMQKYSKKAYRKSEVQFTIGAILLSLGAAFIFRSGGNNYGGWFANRIDEHDKEKEEKSC